MGGRRQAWRVLVALISLAVLWSATAGLEARAQGTDDLAALRDQVSQLLSQGQSAEAVPIAERYASLARERYGEDHLEYGAAIAWLAFVYRARARYAASSRCTSAPLPLEKALGPDHPDVGYRSTTWPSCIAPRAGMRRPSRYISAALAIQREGVGPRPPRRWAPRSTTWPRCTEPGPLRRGRAAATSAALAIREKALGPDHPDVATSLNNLADLYQAQGRYAEAEPLVPARLAIREKALGPDHPDVGTSLNNLADLYRDPGPLRRGRAAVSARLAISEKALGPDHPDVGTVLNNLAELYRAQGRYAEAEPLFQRSLAITEKALGPDHPNVGTSLNNLAVLHFVQRAGRRRPTIGDAARR